ncbi:MAG: SDR family oxidoreductase [Pirellulaceae bacterium]|jgi:NAD(P)-dependent dehydrogenase (short-subunit alcohol dehydrogenase family)|nr:SDR family oxidoreductase [Planctomycetaceae bacterium]HIM28326.1 SDR family oxidoreductase [Planctomycetota bacterium]
MGILDRFSLQGRVALITAGAGPLFGSSLSEALAEAGATVITASRSLQRNEDFAARLRDKGHDAYGLQFDISDCHSITELKEQVLSQFGRLDILVNSALARDGHVGSIGEQKADQCMASASGDFSGLFEICRQFVEPMIDQGCGSMINISSIYGVVSNDPNLYEGTEMKQPPTYNFVKAGMINYTRYLACYYGKYGVRANCISPGGYFANQPQPFLERYEQRVPLGRMMDNDDIQGAVVFLASDASRYVTGANLMVDGGWTCS